MKLSVSNLACSRGDARILADVTFVVESGTALILRGPNGIGKSTLIRVLLGLSPKGSGSVSVSPEDIAYSGHLDGIKSQLTVVENLHFWARVYGASSITAAITHFGLETLADRPAHSLSAGQKRRLGLARMMVTNRPVWIMDEPTVSLDQENVGRFASMVEQHLSCGGSAVIATHIDLGLKSTQTLDVSQFKPTEILHQSPFLDEDFL